MRPCVNKNTPSLAALSTHGHRDHGDNGAAGSARDRRGTTAQPGRQEVNANQGPSEVWLCRPSQSQAPEVATSSLQLKL